MQTTGATKLARRSLGIERMVSRYRGLAAVLAVFQTAIAPGDSLALNYAAVGLFVVSVVVSLLVLRGDPSPRVVRRTGRAAMAVDTAVVISLLANNLTDPGEPIYLVALLGALEAAVRWGWRGGAVGAAGAAVASATWTWAVHDRAGEALDPSYVTMRAGIVAVVVLFLGAAVERLAGERRTLQHTLDVSRDLIVTSDSDGTILTVNSACRQVLGFPPEEIVGRSYREFLLDGDDPAPAGGGEVLEQLRPGGPAVLVEGRFRRADGQARWLELNITSLEGESVVHVVGRDVTERREAARRLAESEQRFRSLFEHSLDAVAAFDLDGRLLAANPATEKLTAHTSAQLAATGFAPVIEPEVRERTVAAFWSAAGGEPTTCDTVLRTRHGERRDVHLTALPIVVDGVVVGVHAIGTDVTERRRLERQLEWQARRDALTGLANRFALEEMLSRLTVDGIDARGNVPGVVFVDLDRFKVVNDSLGHRHGDTLLAAVADRFQRCLRPGDVLARWAGDEFCAVLRGCGENEVVVAARLLEALEEPFVLAGREVRVSASVGVAVWEGTGTGHELLQRADLAMYEAKRRGGGRIASYGPHLDAGSRTRLDVEVELRQALALGELRLAYQPIVDLDSGRVVAVEALARWPRRDGTTSSPADFVPLAEETGLVRSLTRWVLAESCRQLASWHATGRGCTTTMWVSVNISAIDLADPRLVEEVATTLAATGLAPDRLVLEITESMLVQDPATTSTIDGLRRLGVRLAVDDFGTGFSSLSQLHDLPVSSFKLDRAFLEGIDRGARAGLMIGSLVGLGDRMGLPVVAEGVERPDQLAALAEARCRWGQGVLLAPPSTPEQLWDVLDVGSIDLALVGGVGAETVALGGSCPDGVVVHQQGA